MRTLKVNYPRISQQLKIGNKTYVLEKIRDLDEAIDLICHEMTPTEQLDPFAEDLCPYFGVLWPSAEGLARFLDQHPELVKNKSVLELGCGLGLPSLVAKHLGAQVLATDFHPEVEEYYLRNCRHSSVNCDYQRLNWREDSLNRRFDVVLGSDILYESKHPSEVATGLLRFVAPGGTILLSDPGRSYLQQFVTAMNKEGITEDMHSITIGENEIMILKFGL